MRKIQLITLILGVIMVFSSCGTVQTDEGDSVSNNGVLTQTTTEPYKPFDFSTLSDTDSSSFIYQTDYTGKIKITSYIGTEQTVKIPQTIDGVAVETVGTGAFEDASVTYVYIPDSVKYIDSKCFKNCTQLVEVRLSEQILTVSEDCFMGCKKLIKVNIPETVKSIQSSAFYECFSLSDIVLPEGLERIYSGAFMYCNSLKSINFPSTLIGIGEAAFSTSGLTKVDWSKCTVLERVENRVFEDCRMLNELNFPVKTNIRYDDFHNVFVGCTGLRRITVEENENGYFVENNILYYNDLLILAAQNNDVTDIVVKEGTTKINKFAFDGSNITSVTIPNSCTRLGRNAFSDCLSLRKVTMSDNITSMGQDVFSYGGEIEILYRGKAYTRDQIKELEAAVEANKGE